LEKDAMKISPMKNCRTFESHLASSSPALAAPPRLLYSRKESAYQLSLSIRAVDYLIAAGRLKTRRIGGRILVAHDELIRFARADRMEPMTPEVSASAYQASKADRAA
jgi:hypothetical protein